MVVVGQPTVHTTQVTPAIATTAQWLRDTLGAPLRDPDTRHRLVTICSGTLLAARAGLLSTRRCTTHHELLGALRTLAPQAQVIDNRVFVLDGPVASSAGITAGIDIALHLIAEECGEALAASVAEDAVDVPEAFTARPRAVAVSHASPSPARDRTLGTGRDHHPARA